jgi:hypothetical protein
MKKIFEILIGIYPCRLLMIRYGFLRVPSSNCESPEFRNRAAVPTESGSSRYHLNNNPVRRNLLTKSKDDILVQPRKVNDTKMIAKEIERTKKWRNMAIIDRPNGTIHYRFAFTNKVRHLFQGSSLICSWSNGRSRGFLIVGELLSGTNSLKFKQLNSAIVKLNANLYNHTT